MRTEDAPYPDPGAAAAVCLVVVSISRWLSCLSTFYMFHIVFLVGVIRQVSLLALGTFFISEWEILASSMNTGSKLWAGRFS